MSDFCIGERSRVPNFGLIQTVCPAAPLGLPQSQSMSNLIVQNLQVCHLASYIKICKKTSKTNKTNIFAVCDRRHGTGKAGSLNSSHFQIDILRQSSALQASSASVVLPLCLHYYCAPPLPLLPTAASAPAQLAGCRLVLPSSVSRAARFCSSAEQEL